jgi:hypothetical protein
MSDLCYTYPACSNQTLQDAAASVISGCSADLADGSIPDTVISQIFGIYPTLREVLCLKTYVFFSSSLNDGRVTD